MLPKSLTQVRTSIGKHIIKRNSLKWFHVLLIARLYMIGNGSACTGRHFGKLEQEKGHRPQETNKKESRD